jgi:hypothetical protein
MIAPLRVKNHPADTKIANNRKKLSGAAHEGDFLRMSQNCWE